MQSAFQEKFSYTIAVGRLIGDGASDEGFRGGSCFRQSVSGLMTWNPDEDGGAFPVVLLLANRLGSCFRVFDSVRVAWNGGSSGIQL